MHRRDLPQRWTERLARYTDERRGPDHEHRGELRAEDFSGRSLVRLEFPDGSRALFHYAFFIVAPEWNELAVFTEHCGYHVFPSRGLHFERVETGGERPPGESWAKTGTAAAWRSPGSISPRTAGCSWPAFASSSPSRPTRLRGFVQPVGFEDFRDGEAVAARCSAPQ